MSAENACIHRSLEHNTSVLVGNEENGTNASMALEDNVPFMEKVLKMFKSE